MGILFYCLTNYPRSRVVTICAKFLGNFVVSICATRTLLEVPSAVSRQPLGNGTSSSLEQASSL
ncbi:MULTISPECIES: hypothetical protein [unclassified Moorena]|uniref:hypothetical protein n=1 Tax=unclassified Moorena TaxID=2683338 RepID=UPI0014012019|nr:MULTISPECIES: hypothetical protein [unclassified Moorena]NEO13500.1 hypothetical protein [Moorena sp. SIO3E8]NEP98412.1 hypothetical protein [Moorena sp. SIO3F7]